MIFCFSFGCVSVTPHSSPVAAGSPSGVCSPTTRSAARGVACVRRDPAPLCIIIASHSCLYDFICRVNIPRLPHRACRLYSRRADAVFIATPGKRCELTGVRSDVGLSAIRFRSALSDADGSIDVLLTFHPLLRVTFRRETLTLEIDRSLMQSRYVYFTNTCNGCFFFMNVLFKIIFLLIRLIFRHMGSLMSKEINDLKMRIKRVIFRK